MKLLCVKVSIAVLALLALPLGVAPTPALAGHVLDFQVLGKGTVFNDCFLTSTVDCDIDLRGEASGTHIGHDDFRLLLRKGATSAILPNGSSAIPAGVCIVVTGTMTINVPSADTFIAFAVAGLVCEQSFVNSNAGFNLHYRITGGGARFAGRSGGGSLTGAYTRNPGGVVYLHLHGTLDR